MAAVTLAPSLRRPPAPWWLATPTRWGASSPSRAAGVAGAAGLCVAAAAVAAAGAVPGSGDADLILYRGIEEGVRHGGAFYAVAADALAEAPGTRGVPLPTLAVIEALLPFWAAIAGLWWLAAGVALAWWARLANLLPATAPRALAVPLFAAGLAMAVRPDLAAVPAPWAGLLVALALARRRRGRWGEAAATLLAAATIDATAAAATIAMLWAAWRDGERAEATGWIATLCVLAVVLWCHDRAAATIVAGGDATAAAGVPATIAALAAATAFAALPAAAAAALLALAMFGWIGWRGELPSRVAAALAAMAAVLAIAPGEPSPWRLLIVAPLLPLGLLAVPDGLRDLVRARLDTRRIVVRRVVR